MINNSTFYVPLGSYCILTTIKCLYDNYTRSILTDSLSEVFGRIKKDLEIYIYMFDLGKLLRF